MRETDEQDRCERNRRARQMRKKQTSKTDANETDGHLKRQEPLASRGKGRKGKREEMLG